MPIQGLLQQILIEYEALQAKYEEVVSENNDFRACFPSFHATDSSTIGAQQRQLWIEQIHSAAPDGVDGIDTVPSRESGYLKVMSVPSKRQLARGGELRRTVHSILHTQLFEILIGCVVILNMLALWVATDTGAETTWFKRMDAIFLVLCCIEFSARAFAYGRRVFDQFWNKFDFAIVMVDITLWLVRLVSTALDGANVKLLRVFRLFRLSRIVKLLRYSSELQLLVSGFVAAMKALVFAALLLWLIIIMWSFVFVLFVGPQIDTMTEAGMFASCARCQVAYSTITYAHLTLLQTIVAGDSWGEVAFPVIQTYPATAIVFGGSLISIQLGVMNLIITVIVDAAANARASDEKQIAEQKSEEFAEFKEKFISVCEELDQDKSGGMTLEEVTQGLKSQKAFHDTMAAMDITEEDVSTVYKFMDEDNSGQVNYVEFVNNLYRLQRHDLRSTIFFIKGYVHEIHQKIHNDIQDMLEGMDKRLQTLSKPVQSHFNGIAVQSSALQVPVECELNDVPASIPVDPLILEV